MKVFYFIDQLQFSIVRRMPLSYDLLYFCLPARRFTEVCVIVILHTPPPSREGSGLWGGVWVPLNLAGCVEVVYIPHTKAKSVWRFMSWSLGNVEYPFIAITPWSTLSTGVVAVEYTDCISVGIIFPPQWVLDMTLNHLMVRHPSWSFRECGVPLHCHYSQVHSDL